MQHSIEATPKRRRWDPVLDAGLPPADAARKAVFNCVTFRPFATRGQGTAARTSATSCLCARRSVAEPGKADQRIAPVAFGHVDIVDSSTTPAKRIDQDGPGSVLGEMSLLTGQHCSATVIATSECSALVLSVHSYRELREQFPEIEIALSQLVSDRLGQRSHDALCR